MRPNVEAKDRVKGHQDVSKVEARAYKRSAKAKVRREVLESISE